MAVWRGDGVRDGASGGTGVLIRGINEVLVADGTEASVGVEPAALVCGMKVGRMKERGVFVGNGPRMGAAVNAIAVRVLLAFRTAASFAGSPDATQNTSNKITNRPVTPSAFK